jgi:uncharacterized coiled-coil protein SlyX
VVYAAAVTADDPDKRAEIAGIVGSALVRDSFLGLATSYTLDEVIQLSALLSEENTLSPEDARTAVQLDLRELLSNYPEAPSQEVINAAGGEVLRRRSRRRDARAARESARARRDREEALGRVGQLDQRITSLERSDAEKTKLLSGQHKTISAQQNTIRRLKRAIAVLVMGVALGTAMGLLISAEAISGKAEVATIAVGALYVAEGIRFSLKVEVSWWEPVLAAVVSGAWTAIAVGISP